MFHLYGEYFCFFYVFCEKNGVFASFWPIYVLLGWKKEV